MIFGLLAGKTENIHVRWGAGLDLIITAHLWRDVLSFWRLLPYAESAGSLFFFCEIYRAMCITLTIILTLASWLTEARLADAPPKTSRRCTYGRRLWYTSLLRALSCNEEQTSMYSSANDTWWKRHLWHRASACLRWSESWCWSDSSPVSIRPWFHQLEKLVGQNDRFGFLQS